MVEEFDDMMKRYDPSRNRTSPMMTRFERTKVLGLRTEQIARGSLPLLDAEEIEQLASSPTASFASISLHLATQELRKKKTPYVIVRTLPNGKRETWRVADMIVIDDVDDDADHDVDLDDD